MEALLQNLENHPVLFWTVLVAIILLTYLLPTLIATLRNVKGGVGIFLLNLFLGWTLIGYVAAFIWAFTAKTVKEYNAIYKN